jgi:hypothetical protein
LSNVNRDPHPALAGEQWYVYYTLCGGERLSAGPYSALDALAKRRDLAGSSGVVVAYIGPEEPALRQQ